MLSSSKPRILFLVDWYLPGYRAGGPIRSIANLVRGLGEEVECMILTTDRDLGDDRPYQSIKTNSWVQGEFGERICYLSPEQVSRRRISELIIDSGADIVHLNSMYSKAFTVWPIMDKAKGVFSAHVILAPRGMLAKGAMSLKPIKKRGFLKVFKLKKWHRLITWQASAEHEVKEIVRVFGNVDIELLPNFPAPVSDEVEAIPKEKNELRMVCLTRMARVKNIEFLLVALSDSQKRIRLDLYGPKEDQKYFDRCRERMANMPEHITASYQGEVHPQDVSKILNQYHIYALPTKGENFGHSIYEALAVGRPVIISDKTPWTDLGRAGRSLRITDSSEWTRAIDEFAEMDQQEWLKACVHAREYALERGEHQSLKQRYLKSFYTYTS